jgi:hypothetical protein
VQTDDAPGLPDEMIVYWRVSGRTVEEGARRADPRANSDLLFAI